MSRVALPRNTGNTPYAIGSKVPLCPMRFSFKMRRQMATASWLVIPGGFKNGKTPSII